ncbi:MAG: two-component regulator propeller domain-containing protein [Crocinitomicaceae bacterium]
MSRFDGENFTHFTQREGLSSNIVYSIVEDEWNNLWMSTESGIISLANTFDDVSPNDRDEKITLNCFVKNDGLKALDFYYNSVCLDGNNRIWWGSGKGLTMLDLSKNSRTVKPLCVNLKQIDINEHSVDYGNLPDDLRKEITFDGIKSFENYPINLELSNH